VRDAFLHAGHKLVGPEGVEISLRIALVFLVRLDSPDAILRIFAAEQLDGRRRRPVVEVDVEVDVGLS
jgi:hypothetical protein